MFVLWENESIILKRVKNRHLCKFCTNKYENVILVNASSINATGTGDILPEKRLVIRKAYYRKGLDN